MTKAMIALPLAAILGTGASAGAEQAPLLQPGEYQVTSRLELPHMENLSGALKVDSICVTAGNADTHGLGVLSDLNPLRKCPASNVLQNGDTLVFDIICPGSDAA